jgi:DNA-binding transcriptional LysR family regulator
MLDWDKLKLFYQVATAGSITTAAERLNISQPALSRSILNLEARLKTKLFERHKRGISLTRHGEILYRGAHKMFLESRQMEQALQEGGNEVQGNLNVITTPAIASTWLMKHIPGFLAKYPDVRIKVFGQLENSDITDGDVVIMTYLPLQPNLIQKYITTFYMRLYASQAYLDKFGTPTCVEDLDNHRLISFNSGNLNPLANMNWILNVGHKGGGMREPYLEFNSAACILKAAKLGLGIVELAKGYSALEGVPLVEVLPDQKGPAVDLFYIYPEHKKKVRKITAFLEHLTGKSEPTETTLDQEAAREIKLTSLG